MENWVILGVLVFLNWLRVQVNAFSVFSCITEECLLMEQAVLFTSLGAIIFGTNLILLLFSVYYERKYLWLAGVKHVHEYAAYLEHHEDITSDPLERRNEGHHTRLTQEDLRVKIQPSL